MDRAQFELIGNVGKIEIKPLKDDKKLALISLATSERWKPEGKDWIEKTYWHRVAVFAAGKVALIEKAVQVGTRLRLVGQIRPSSWEDDRGVTKYGIEFVVTGPRGEFKQGMIDAFYEGMKHRPDTTFGTFNDDYLAFKDPQFRRIDVCSVVLGSKWPT